MTDLKIDLYTDISCPWCIIGQHRLDKVLDERFPGLAVDIEHHPVFLVPDCPPEGLRVADMLKSRYGITDPAAGWARPEAEARASGLALSLSHQPFLYPTLAAHTLVRLARPLGTQHQLATALSAAYFLEAQNIADPDVLADIAVRHGFDRTAARRQVQDGAEQNETRHEAADVTAQGIRAVPHFVFGEHFSLNGGQHEDGLATAIQQALARSGVPA